MLRSSQTFRFRPNHQMASLPSRTDALIPEFFLCLTHYQTFIVKVELPATPWVGVLYQHFAKTTQGLILHRRHVGASPICVLEQVKGIEPSSTAWKAVIIAVILHLHFSSFSTLHIYYIRFLKENQIFKSRHKHGIEPFRFLDKRNCLTI